MADINFFEPERREPEKSKIGMLLVLIVAVIAGVLVVLLTLSKITELAGLKNELEKKVSFIENPDTKQQIDEYYTTQNAIAKVSNEKMPVTQAYVYYRQLNTATGSLIKDYVWAPIKEKSDVIEFTSLDVNCNYLDITSRVLDISAQRDYQQALAAMKVNVDEYNIDKMPGSQKADGDKEIQKFKGQYTSQIIDSPSPDSDLPFESNLSISINKDFTRDMTNMLGKGR